MPPKQIKKTEIKTEEPIELLMKEWADIAKEEAVIDEAKNKIIKRKEAMITKLWDHINKNPTEQILIEKPKEPVVEKVKEPVVEKPKAPAKTKKTKASEEEIEEETPKAPVKKAAVKKAAAKEEKPVVEEKPKTPAATKKVTAPPKGTAKPKVVNEAEVKKLEHDSSSDTDVDSLSSVSSESEGSDGGED